MESALYGVYTLVFYQKSHSFASLTCSISDTPQLVCKHRTRALSMKYSICVGCDVPAARKVFGFTGHASSKGCSKCNKLFPGNVSTSLDFSGFEACPERSNNEHRKEAHEVQAQTSATDRNRLEHKYSTRFTELMRLPYFD